MACADQGGISDDTGIQLKQRGTWRVSVSDKLIDWQFLVQP